MPSSTSSSNDALPHDPRGLTVVVAVVLFAIGLAGVETFWRQRGHHSSIVDDKALWARNRDAVYDAGTKTVALVGSSRMLLDFSTEVLRDRFPDYEVVQLAVHGTFPIATLRDLAADEQFRGIVIYAADAMWLRCDKPIGDKGEQDKYTSYYHRQWSLDKRLNRSISSWLQERLVTTDPNIRTRKIIEHVVRGDDLPKPRYVVTHRDRSRSADYSVLDPTLSRQHSLNLIQKLFDDARDQDLSQWIRGLNEIEVMVENLQQRGGQVVFVRFPMTDEGLALYEKHYPRRIYWDTLVARTQGVTVHFADVPAMSDFDCPDTSHLDYRDKPRFTHALLDELVRRGVFPGLVRTARR